MVISELREQDLALAIVASVVGIAASWLTTTPFGLLAPGAAFFLFVRGRAAHVFYAALGVAFAGSMLTASLFADGMRDLALLWAAFFALALCIAAIVAAGIPARTPSRIGKLVSDAIDAPLTPIPATACGSSGEAESQEARVLKIVESMRGHAWSADAAGNFTYVSRNALTFLGHPRENLDHAKEEDEFGWRQFVHPDDYDRVAARWRHCLRTGEHYDTEHRLRRADGVYRWFRIAGKPSRNSQGRITGWYGTTMDIEDLKQAQATLHDRERELSQLVDLVPSHLWRLTPDGEPTFFNKRMVDFLGLDIAGTDKPGITRLEPVVETVHPDDVAAFEDALKHCLATGESFAMRYRLRRTDGIYRWMSSRAEPLRDPDGCIVQWYGLCHDIDDQVEVEEALRRSERHLQRLVEALPVNIVSWTPAGELTFVSKRYMEELGLSEATFEEHASAAHELVHPDDAPEVRRKAATCLQAGDAFVMRYRRCGKDGAYRWTDGRFEPLRDQDGAVQEWYGISIDIDDVVRTQEALHERERELSHLVNMVPSYLWRLTPEGEPNFFNKRLIDFFGLDITDADKPDRSRLAGIIESVIHPDDAAGVGQALKRCFVTGERFSMKYRLRRADGVYRWVAGSAEPMRDESGRIVQWYGLSHDIDDQLRVEEALRERERFLWQLVETLPAMIDCAAPDGEPIYRSQQLREFLGYNLADLDETGTSRLAGTLDAGIHPDDLSAVKASYAHALATGEPYARRHRLRRFDGEYRWVETRAAAMRNAEGVIVQWNVICLDIESEVRAQQELRLAKESQARASQAASLAELSASIAHEVNQPLAAIVANSHACHRWLSAEPPNVERAKITADRIIRDANSAADVVSRIRALFRQAPHTRSSEDLNRVISEVCRLMADEIAAKDVRIEKTLEQNLPSVALDRVQVQQVFVNLIRNGIEAMDAEVDGVRALEIRSRRDGLDAIRVEVRDAGIGFKDAERVFEPFFTTKQNGMGMGLAVCRSIVESHGGRLWTTNNETRGATIAFTLPLAAADVP